MSQLEQHHLSLEQHLHTVSHDHEETVRRLVSGHEETIRVSLAIDSGLAGTRTQGADRFVFALQKMTQDREESNRVSGLGRPSRRRC